MNFEVNPYDPCVANKTVNGSQMTMMWHVDDLKVSHKESTEVTKCIIALGRMLCDGLSVTRGKVHSYPGMCFNYSTKGDVMQSMISNSR